MTGRLVMSDGKACVIWWAADFGVWRIDEPLLGHANRNSQFLPDASWPYGAHSDCCLCCCIHQSLIKVIQPSE